MGEVVNVLVAVAVVVFIFRWATSSAWLVLLPAAATLMHIPSP